MTRALQLRDINPWEGPSVFALTGDRNVMRYMGFKVHDSVDDATRLIMQYKQSPSRWQALYDQGSPSDILGILGVEVQGHAVTSSLMLRRDWKTRGAGREFAGPFVEFVFSKPHIRRLWSYVHVDNRAGQHMTEELGAAREGLLRKFAVFPNVDPTEPQDVFVYSVVR